VMAHSQAGTERIVVVGSGWHYVSGISHYTYCLTTALSESYPTGALLMRGLVPLRFYPGRRHVGISLTNVDYPATIPVYDGVDWYWGQSLKGALRYLDRERPTVLILQWWTGAVLHSYLRLARYAKRLGALVILEWHEGQDVGEAALPAARLYVRSLLPRLLRIADAHVVHSTFDLQSIRGSYDLRGCPVAVIPHGPYDHLVRPADSSRDAPDGAPMRLLYLGVVRPFKGVEDLVDAFSLLDREQAGDFHLSIVGETWEGWTAAQEAIARSPHADLIERVDRYVTDAELAEYYQRADAVVLPYRRSSSSGPLQIAMSAGLPVIVTEVGGLIEAVQDYAGAELVPARDPSALRDALLRVRERRGQRYADPCSWTRTTQAYKDLIHKLRSGVSRPRCEPSEIPASGAEQP
jgi:glycosyltransferase involved in cell wall biosynthesis